MKSKLRCCFYFSARITGHLFKYLPLILKKWLAIFWCHKPRADIAGKWFSEMANVAYASVPSPCEIFKSKFRFYHQIISYSLYLDISQFTQRKYVFENCGQELGYLMIKHLNPDSIFVDVGAHVGFFSMLAASLVEKGQVYSFEPMPDNFQRLIHNIKINNFSNIKPNLLALSNFKGKEELYHNPKNDGGHSLNKEWIQKSSGSDVNSTGVEVIPFDEWAEKQNIKRMDFVKIDVEGYELNVLDGMKSSLEKMKPKIICCEVNQITAPEVIDILTKYDYHAYQTLDKRLQTYFPPSVWSFDIVFLKGNYPC